MKISNLIVKNYRNIEDINVEINGSTAFIGNNNSGKSNILRALTLPFMSNDVGYTGKNLTWSDINNNSKNKYYKYIIDNQNAIIEETVDLNELKDVIPKVVVEITLIPNDDELYFVRDLSYDVNDTDIKYGIAYEYFPLNVKDVLIKIKEILISLKKDKCENKDLNAEDIESIKMNLLPIDLYSHSIKVPRKKTSIPYDTLKYFKYTSLVAERDEFSQSSERLGSKSLVKLLQMKLDLSSKIVIEKEYSNFFNKVKDLSGMDNVINWQEGSNIENAMEFFENISILPNMPNMNSLFNSVKLGYADEQLSLQGLGHRNIILLFVLLNSFIEKNNEIVYSIITLEEPEAHLCINNKKLLSSYMNIFTKKENSIQLFYSTHSKEFINKLDFESIILVNSGNVVSLSHGLTHEEKDYLSKNPNLDLYKLFFSRKCILVEGLTEEILIRAYFNSKESLSDIEVISFHKGFTKIMDIWLILNEQSSNKLGVIRDYDNQIKALENHDNYNRCNNICIKTTNEYTLEPEIVKTGNNYKLLKKYFEDTFEWTIVDEDDLSSQWVAAKSSVMLQVCKDISNGMLKELLMPAHIQEVINFLSVNDNN